MDKIKIPNEEEIKEIEQTVKKLPKNLQNFAYILLIAGCVFSGSWGAFSGMFGDTIEKELADITARLDEIYQYSSDNIAKTILNQASKITSGKFDTINPADMDMCIKYRGLAGNSPEVQIAYDICLEWYKAQFGQQK